MGGMDRELFVALNAIERVCFAAIESCVIADDCHLQSEECVIYTILRCSRFFQLLLSI